MGPSKSCWNGKTSALLSEEITLKGTSFMCILSIKVPLQKSLETYLMILVPSLKLESNYVSCMHHISTMETDSSQRAFILTFNP